MISWVDQGCIGAGIFRLVSLLDESAELRSRFVFRRVGDEMLDVIFSGGVFESVCVGGAGSWSMGGKADGSDAGAISLMI